jgi:hypothetical protein
MQLRSLVLSTLLAGALAGGAAAQSLSPMHNEGVTPSDIKGFKLLVGNPYKTRMTFLVIPMDTKFKVAAADAAVNFPEITMVPGGRRQVIVTFKIGAAQKERTIGVCVQPKDLDGPVLPRVCGTYTGKLSGVAG